MRNRLATISLVGIMAFAPALNTGCSTYASDYDSQGRYIGERRVDDPGRTLQTFGALNGGLLGLGIQAMGEHLSRDQQKKIMEERMFSMQRQFDQASQDQTKNKSP